MSVSCAICLSPYDDEDDEFVSTRCGHAFHRWEVQDHIPLFYVFHTSHFNFAGHVYWNGKTRKAFERLDKGFRGMTSIFNRRSKKTECPHCRKKWTARTLTKLFLTVSSRDDDQSYQQYLDLQKEKLKTANLQKDNDQAFLQKEQMQNELQKSREEYQNLM